MKTAINNSIDLNLPNFSRQFIIQTDASNEVIAAILKQKYDCEEKVIYFINRKLNTAELNYTTTEKECLAIIWAVKQFRIYLCNEFIIQTDHNPLKWLLAYKDSHGRIIRWILTLQGYKYKIEYISGKKKYISRFTFTLLYLKRVHICNQ